MLNHINYPFVNQTTTTTIDPKSIPMHPPTDFTSSPPIVTVPMPLLKELSKDYMPDTYEKESSLASDSDHDTRSTSTSFDSRRPSSASTADSSAAHSVQTSLVSDLGLGSISGSSASESKAHSGVVTPAPTTTSTMSTSDRLVEVFNGRIPSHTPRPSTPATPGSPTSQSATHNTSDAARETNDVADIIRQFVIEQRARDKEAAAVIQGLKESLQLEILDSRRRDSESSDVINSLRQEISVLQGSIGNLVNELDTERKEKAQAAQTYEREKAAAAEIYQKDKAATAKTYADDKRKAAEATRKSKEEQIRQYTHIMKELVNSQVISHFFPGITCQLTACPYNLQERHVLKAINARTVTDNIMKFLARLLKLPGLYKDLLNGSLIFRQWLEEGSMLPTDRHT